MYNGQSFSQGQSWQIGCDTTCTCENAVYGYYRCVNRYVGQLSNALMPSPDKGKYGAYFAMVKIPVSLFNIETYVECVLTWHQCLPTTCVCMEKSNIHPI